MEGSHGGLASVAMGVVSAKVQLHEGGLLVAWELDGEASAVEVSVGATPEAVDHSHAVTVPAGERSVILPEDGSAGRRYISVAAQGSGGSFVVAERRVPFDGVTNFRDLGGYPTAQGTHTRWGRVFRSDALHKLTSRDLEAYAALGLNAVYDLRGDAEREKYPNPFPSVQLSLLSQVSASAAVASEPESLEGREIGERLLREMYKGMLRGAAPLFGRLLGGLAEPGSLPAVFHCTGGKDRTGVSAALLLELLGVSREQVLDDYELTSQYRLREHQTESYENLLAAGLPPEAAAAVLGAPRSAMADALRELDEVHGGIGAYLTGPAGLSSGKLEHLSDLLTV